MGCRRRPASRVGVAVGHFGAFSQGRRSPAAFAFLVGVNTYEKAGFKNLDWAVNDAKELREELLDLGFDKVVLLTSEEKGDLYASKTNIETQSSGCWPT